MWFTLVTTAASLPGRIAGADPAAAGASGLMGANLSRAAPAYRLLGYSFGKCSNKCRTLDARMVYQASVSGAGVAGPAAAGAASRKTKRPMSPELENGACLPPDSLEMSSRTRLKASSMVRPGSRTAASRCLVKSPLRWPGLSSAVAPGCRGRRPESDGGAWPAPPQCHFRGQSRDQLRPDPRWWVTPTV
jgi:hypothetical protein